MPHSRHRQLVAHNLQVKLNAGNPEKTTLQGFTQKRRSMSSALGCLPVNGKPGMRRSPISHLGSAELWRYAEIYCKEFISFALARLLLDGGPCAASI